jgi:hypothetical protein
MDIINIVDMQPAKKEMKAALTAFFEQSKRQSEFAQKEQLDAIETLTDAVSNALNAQGEKLGGDLAQNSDAVTRRVAQLADNVEQSMSEQAKALAAQTALISESVNKQNAEIQEKLAKQNAQITSSIKAQQTQLKAASDAVTGSEARLLAAIGDNKLINQVRHLTLEGEGVFRMAKVNRDKTVLITNTHIAGGSNNAIENYAELGFDGYTINYRAKKYAAGREQNCKMKVTLIEFA